MSRKHSLNIIVDLNKHHQRTKGTTKVLKAVLCRLAGAKRNRVVAKNMFGAYSQAIFYGSEYSVNRCPKCSSLRYRPKELGQFVTDYNICLDCGHEYCAIVKRPAWKSHWKEGDNVTEDIGAKFHDA